MNQLRLTTRALCLRAPSHAFALLGASLCALACGNRYEIGDIAAKQLPQRSDGSTSAPRMTAPATVSAVPRTIIADAYDVDATVEEPDSPGGYVLDPDTGEFQFQGDVPRMAQIVPLGDVDGDGYGDWAEVGYTSISIAYGAPRPQVGGVIAPDRSSFDFAGQGTGLQRGRWAALAGDVNGDGYADMFIYGSIFASATRDEAGAGGTIASQGMPWDTPLALLVLGGPERALGSQPPPNGALGFSDRDGLAGRLASELASGAKNTTSTAFQSVNLHGLGDLNHDGFADFSVTTTFSYFEEALSAGNPPEWTERERRTESVTYLVYGSSSLDSSTAAAARLAGIGAVYPAGDVNGDGFGDLLLVGSGRVCLWSGGAEPPSGDLDPEVDAVPLDGITPAPSGILDSNGSVGDLDHDGYDDFIVDGGSTDDMGAFHESATLFYGRPDVFSASLAASSASAVLSLEPYGTVQRAGDWNADGYDDLIIDHEDLYQMGQEFTALVDTRLLPGTPQRWTGTIPVPADQLAMLSNSEQTRKAQYQVAPAGDLDGDGFADLLLRRYFPSADPRNPIVVVGSDTAIKYGSPLPALPTQIR